jgi:hypothetical protein
MVSYYDTVLGLIPLVLVVVSGMLVTLGFDLTTAVPLAALPVVGLIGHAMFVRTPTDAAADTGFQPAD